MLKKFDSEDEARRAVRSADVIKKRKGIKDVKVMRMKSIVYLKKVQDGRQGTKNILIRRLEELDSMIKSLENEYRRTADELEKISKEEM